MGVSPRPSKDCDGNPGEGNHDASQRRIQIPDTVQIVKLVKAATLQCWHHNLGNPSSEVYERDTDGNEPAGE